MLVVERTGTRGPIVFLLHWLGGSSRTWHEVSVLLAARGLRCIAIDLPGFGQSRHIDTFSIPQMLAAVTETIRTERQADPTAPWLLVGHSMGGKLSMLLASAAEQRDPALANLQGLILVSPSTPGPEPMSESKRADAIKNLGPQTTDPAACRSHAAAFVDANTGKLPLLPAIRDRSIDDVLLMNPEALLAWMTTGSKLDCAQQVGTLHLPALIMVGTEEPALGPDAQTQHTLPHIPSATIVGLHGSSHLAPLERPFEVADRMLDFITTALGLPLVSLTEDLSPAFAATVHSDRTSPQTRDVLVQRLAATDLPSTGVLSSDERRTLRALAACIVPGVTFELADRIDRALAAPQHDGWRFNALPSDATAWKLGLASLDAASLREHHVPFIALDSARQQALLHRAQTGDLGPGLLAHLGLGESAHAFTAAQMRDWFEDVRSEFARLYIADPRTMQRIGFTGFADEAGFTQITLESQQEPQSQKEPQA